MTFTANRGHGLESLILASQSPSTVLLTKVPTASKRIRTPHGPTIIQCRSACDFFGIYVPTRQLIVFDAKQSDNANRLDTSVTHLPEHQVAELVRYGDAGSIAGILAESTAGNELFWCPYSLLRTRRPSVTWEKMVSLGSSKFAIRWDKIGEYEYKSLLRIALEEAVTP